MSSIITCLDMNLPEFMEWVNSNLRSGFEPRFLNADLAELWQTLPFTDYLVLFESKITDEMIAASPRLKLIQLPQVGYDNIDIKAATKAGVSVCNTPGIVAYSVAEHTLLLILATLRRLLECDASVRELKWPQYELFRKGIHDFRGSTLGIIGFGNIGKALAKICSPMAGRILYYDVVRSPISVEHELGVTYVDLNELLRQSDVVSLHVPLNETTRGLIGQKELSQMKPGAILINTARGPVIDHDALVAHLREGSLGGAGLDVLWHEPPPADSPLLELDNVVLTPHVASNSREATWECFRIAFENVYRVDAGIEPLHRVN